MNEIIFLIHILCVSFASLWALRLGKAALMTFVALQVICANLFVFKQMHIFGWTLTCSDAFAVGAILGVNLIQEYFGMKEARAAIWRSFFFLFFFLAMGWILVAYVPLHNDPYHAAFELLFSHSLRVCVASVGVYALVQFWDVQFFKWLKNWFRGDYLPFRIGLSLVVSQGLDTVLFSFAGLYGIVASIGNVILMSFCIKCLIIMISSPWTALSRRFMKEDHVSI